MPPVPYPTKRASIPQEIIETRATTKSKNLAEDPTGQFPTAEHFFSTNIAKEARGVARNDLEYFTQYDGIDISSSNKVQSEYLKNQVSKSEKGHVWEVDDTDGNERILIKHLEGSGIELLPDGGVTISSKGRKLEVIGGTNEVIVEGDAQLVYKGNLNIKVVGEFNIDCLDYNVTVNGNKVETINGSEQRQIGNGTQMSVTGPITTYSTGFVTDVFLAGHQHNVKGNMDYNVNGNVGLFSSGEMNITSEDYINISSDNVTASANNMTIQGGNGVIGGDSVHIKGEEGSFEKSVEAPNFWGNLIGKAKFAALADKATGATTAGSIGSSGTASNPSEIPAVPSFVAPTTSKVTSYLTKAAGGIRKVLIDKGDYIKNFIDKTKDYGGVYKSEMTSTKARSKLRDATNASNTQLIGQLLKEKLICSEYNNPTPKRIGRTIKQESTPILSNKPTDIYSTRLSATFIPKNNVVSIVPEDKYNPLRQNDITIKTPLADNITIAKFLGTDDPTNLSFIKDISVKRELAKHLYLQTLILKKVQGDVERFRGVNLVVTEGIYRPGPNETITPKSINDLKTKGRAVVYKAVNKSGVENNLALFDIAEYLKDVSYFDELILSYDTLECDENDLPILKARLIAVMPELNDRWTAKFNRKISTEYNRQLLSKGEFIECLLETEETLEQKAVENSAIPPSDEIVTHERGADRKHWPNQAVVDAIAKAVRELGSEYTARITQNGGRAQRPSGTKNHPIGEAADHYLLLNGKRINPSDNTSLYTRYLRILVRNAKTRGVRPGVGSYPSFIHYDESSWRQGGAGTAGYWTGSSNNVTGPDFSFVKSL